MNKLKKLIAKSLITAITITTSLTAFASTETVINKMDYIMGYSYGSMFTLNDAINTDFFMNRYNSTKEAITDIISTTYKAESGWWDEYIALPVYFGVLNGYEDGTLKPNQSVKACEVAKIVATAYEPIIQEVDGLNNADFNGQWYNKYYNAIALAFTYKGSADMTSHYMNSNMRRCEIAYVLANVCNDGTLDSYIAKAEQGDLSQMAGYTDFTNVANVPQALENEQSAMENGQIPARFAGAVMYLQAKGIMVGDGAGHINPLDNVSRAEVFKLIQTTCQNTPSYTKNKFYGWETGKTQGTGNGTSTSVNQMTENTVLNPNAPAELQYKVNDINENSYKYILNGQANIAEKQLSKEYTQPIVDKVKASVQFKDGYTEVTIPDLKSDYHEVYVLYDINENGNWVDSKTYTSTEKSGTIRLEGDCYGIMIGIRGREDKASIKSLAARTSYTWAYSIENGGWQAY